MGGSIATEKRTKASFDQAGLVWSTKIGNKTDLRYLNFAFNYHKRANFNRQFYGKGALNGLSMTYQMANMINNAGYATVGDFYALLDAGSEIDDRNPYTHPDFYSTPYLAMMGARAGLVDVNPNVDADQPITQIFGWNGETGEYYSREEGGINQYDFNLSFNIRDRFYFGLTLGLYDLNYNLYSSYGETMNREMQEGGVTYHDKGDFTLNNWYKAEGTGVDLKLGTIIRPFEYSPFRFGLAIHTPIWYTLTDRYTATLTSNIANEGMPTASYFENLSKYFYPDENYVWDYSMVTPWRFNVSAGTIVGGIMALDAEYEYAKYSSASINTSAPKSSGKIVRLNILPVPSNSRTAPSSVSAIVKPRPIPIPSKRESSGLCLAAYASARPKIIQFTTISGMKSPRL